MVETDKKSNYLIWIAVAIVILLVVFGVIFYFVWRKTSTLDINHAKNEKVVNDMRVELATLKSDIAKKDERIQELTKETADLKQKNTELAYAVKDIKKMLKGMGVKTQQVRIADKCTDGTCEVKVRNIDE